MSRLTDIAIQNLPIPDRVQTEYADKGSPLKIRVSRGGAKTFFVVLGHGKRHVIGRYGTVSLQDARRAARTLKAEKTLGRILPRSVTLLDARRQYLDQLKVRRNTFAHYKRNLLRLEASKLSDVTPREINRILDSLGASSATQALRAYSAFFNWCIRRHYLDTSPVARLAAPKSASHARLLTDEEIKLIWRATEEPTHFNTITRLLLLTGQRRNEIASIPIFMGNERLDYITELYHQKWSFSYISNLGSRTAVTVIMLHTSKRSATTSLSRPWYKRLIAF